MNSHRRSGNGRKPVVRNIANFRVAPLAQALALMLVAGSAHAAPAAFSSGWFGAMGTTQSQMRSSGMTPTGALAGIPSTAQQQQQSQQQLQQSLNNLNRTAAAIAAQQAAQAAARLAAMNAPSGVPDGLADGGLKIDTNALTKGWLNANAPMQSTSGGKTTVAIQQTADKAILNWETFNVGKNTTVQFGQQADWAVLNRVNDPSAKPSQIQGQIKGAGTVMVMNRNGVIFSGSSQVNVRNLVAAAANITDKQFTANGIYSTQTGGVYVPSFTNASGQLIVEAGAQIATANPGSVTQGGGYVLLMGQQVSNDGDIETPKGQVGLAAGDSFAIRKGVGTDVNQSSTTRGNEISPQLNAGSSAGQVINTGLLVAREGDVTLTGHDVRQNGIAVATTTVNTRGTIHLLNSASDATGQVTLGGTATTAILIDDDGKTTALDSQRDALGVLNGNALAMGQFNNLSTLTDRRDQSRVEIVSGGDVVFDGGSMTLTTGGQIAVSAARRTFVADGANLDVAGAVGVQVAMDSNNILVNVQGNELRDAPINRDSGKLFNNDVWVDTRGLLYVRAGTGGDDSERWYTAGGLLEVSGYLSNQGHRVGEWASLGGTVALSGNQVVTQAGSQINISGGSIDTTTGFLKQTWVKGADGQLYNISSAPADLAYTGVYKGYEDTHARWGDTATRYFLNPLIAPQRVLQNGYTVGRDAGQLIVSSPTEVLEGDIVAAVYNGPGQVDSRPNGVTDGYKLAHDTAALSGRLVVGQYTGLGLVGGVDSDVRIGDIGGITQGMGASDVLANDRTNTVWLDANHLNAQDLGGLTLVSTDEITIGAPLTLSTGGQLLLAAPQVDVVADITAHGGAVNMGNFLSTIPAQGKAPIWVALTDAQGQSQVNIDNDAKIDLSGLWLNQLDGFETDSSALAFLNGGTLNVATTGGVTFAAGSIIDVSSGAAILANGRAQGGKGGNVSLIANDDTHSPSLTADPSAQLVVDGKIIAYGFNGGGTLTLKAGQTVVIGEDAALSGGHLAAGTPTTTSIRLGAGVVIPPGGTMPFDYNAFAFSTPLDTPQLALASTTVSVSSPIIPATNWTVPPGMSLVTTVKGYSQGDVVPANEPIIFIQNIPAGTVIPSSVFPNGIPTTGSLTASYKAGDVVSAPVTLPSGTLVPIGTKFDSSVTIQAALSLNQDIFRSGFSNYAVSSNTGIEVAGNISVDVPVYRFDAASYSAATGNRVSGAADVWLPSTYLEDPSAGRLTQRAGANLTLSSLYDFNMTRGSSITVDQEQNVTIHTGRQTTIEGSIVAHGGNITVDSMLTAPNGATNESGFGILTPTRSIWIGEDSTLDVSAQAVIASDARGHSYGIVPNGGSITIGKVTAPDGTVAASDAFIIVRPGAVLDASGTAGMIDVASASGLQPTLVASDGGTIELYSASGIYLDGDLRAVAGGAGASGGLLSLNVLSHTLRLERPTPNSPHALGPIPEEMQKLRNITIVQHGQGSTLSADLAPGERDPALKFGEATISVDRIHAGGFDQLDLSTKDLFVFSGNVDLTMNRGLTLSGGVFSASASDPHASVHLAAPYVKLNGWNADGTLAANGEYYTGLNSSVGSSLNTAADSSFTVDADLLDVSSAAWFGMQARQGNGTSFDPALQVGSHDADAPGFQSIVLRSDGDIRFGTGTLTAEKNLTLEAVQIYPLSGATFVITMGQKRDFDPEASVTIRGNGAAIPEVPPSVFGNLSIIAPNIDQGGVVRAPLGVIAFNNLFGLSFNSLSAKVIFREGSLTSTSADGLTIPFGGTSDGVSYQGTDGTIKNLGPTTNGTGVETGLMVTGQSVVGEPGAVLDISGGGNLIGAGFVSGRGGSINVLKTTLANANPTNSVFSSVNDKVYAIVPGMASAYAPTIATNGDGDPAIGQQITVPSATPGLPAGTYTLLPSSYALMPGAYRVELGNKTSTLGKSVRLPNGSFMTSGYLGVANTRIRDSLPTQIILTGGQTVRTYSQYNETSYADFLRTQADLFGGIRPRLPSDGGILQFALGIPPGGDALEFQGTALFKGAGDGISGTMIIGTSSGVGTIDITAPGQAGTAGHVSISSDTVNAFKAPSLLIGGNSEYNNNGLYGGRINFNGASVVNVLNGATLRAGQIFLIGTEVNVSDGATLDTRGLSGNGVDSTLGYIFGNTASEVDTPTGPAVLAVANGWFSFLPFVGDGKINIGNGATLLTEGSIVFGAPGGFTMGDANLGARFLSVTQNIVNIGTDSTLASAQAARNLPAGWNLTQTVLDRLLHPSAIASVPALEQLTIVAGGSINFIGDVSLDARGNSGSDVQFVMNTPALYGLGSAGEGAHISADAFVWNGIRTGNGAAPGSSPNARPYGSKDPSSILVDGPGTGSGTLDISAQTVLFGYGDNSRRTDGASLNRYAIGFSAVNVNASELVTTNSDGSLFVGLSRDGSGNVQGGNLNITTPLFTAQQGAIMAFNAGGAITVVAPAGAAPANTENVTNLGGTVSFNGDTVLFDTAAALPSGKLTLDAVSDVSIGEHATVDLSGRHLTFFDKSVDSWGGDIMLQSAQGNISQAAGSLIDVSAENNVAGTITASATDSTHGLVMFDGALKGASSGGYASGEFTIQAQELGDFVALNTKLNDAGFFGARAFDIKRGDLAVGNEVKANFVSISVDGGKLTVNGTIDASGDNPGTIRLAARDDLTLASSAVLDTHSTKLKADSYGTPIEADNAAHVELTTTNGTLVLSPGATIDMRVTDPANMDASGNPVIAYGHLELNAPRTGIASGISATQDPATGSIAAPANATGDSIAISAAGPLNIKGASGIALNGFATYKNAPVDPDDANGQIVNQAWLDLINQDSQVFIGNLYNNDVAAGQLSGDLQARIAGLLDAKYSSVFHIRPGVEIVGGTPNGNLSAKDDLDFASYRYGPNTNSALLGSGEPGKLVIRAAGDLKINGSITDGFAAPPSTPDENGFQTLSPRTVAIQTTFLSSNVILAEAFTIPVDDFYINTIQGAIDPAGNIYFPGDTIPAGTTIDISSFPFAWEAGITIPALAIPGAPRPVYALAQPLAPGSMSWSMRLVSGADTGAADSRVLRSAPVLNGTGNMTLSDLHLGGSDNNVVASVIRTGTGDLELLAGGNFTQASAYGIYTAGTPIAKTDGGPYSAGRGKFADGTVLGPGNDTYDATLKDANGDYLPLMYYMAHGGNLLLTAQGDIDGSLAPDSGQVGGWLWRQGGAELNQPTAWGINFGSYTASNGGVVHLSTFSGVGALGGGNVSVRAGGDIGDGGGVVFAIGGSGRIMADGSLVQTGGGTLSVKAGGNFGIGGNEFVNVLGNTDISAGDFGNVYGNQFGFNGDDPRPVDPLKSYSISAQAGGAIVPGDGLITLRMRGDVVIGDISDPGRVAVTQMTDADTQQGSTWFTLWEHTAIDVFGAGGTVSPFPGGFLPPVLRAIAANGDIYVTGDGMMLPSPSGKLELLADGSIIQPSSVRNSIGPLSTSLSALATPLRPAWATFSVDGVSPTLSSSNYWSDLNNPADGSSRGDLSNPFVFLPYTVSDASAFGDGVASTIYAVRGDISNLVYGSVLAQALTTKTFTDYYRAAKPLQMRAGGDIVNLKGLILQNDPDDVSVIAASGNVVYAGPGDFDRATGMMTAGLKIAGPGTLEVSAGRNLYQGSTASIESIGPLVTGDKRPGTSIVLQAGMGAGAPGEGQVDWTGFAGLYLDPANLAGSGPLADQPGKVAKTYNSELIGWLKSKFNYAGSAEGALAYFFALPSEQQHIFLRLVYYAELTAGGREFTAKNGPRTGSYLRGREAAAALFPHEGAYDGDITAFSAVSTQFGGITVSGYTHTDFGGDIQFLAPGGGVTVGSDGLAPGADSGLITQGGGNIQIYSKESILLGLSRIMTTFGGDIMAWSAEGDINAGRGSKTTVVFTPPKRAYDDVGDVVLAPQVPSTGAGIATLNPIPEVPAGDVDLIAPLGTVDAGEAGIRVSGNINIAALHVVNAANIQVQGKSTGIPVVAAVNTSALTSASAAASSAANAAQDVTRQQQAAARQALPSIITVQVLGFGNQSMDSVSPVPAAPKRPGDPQASYDPRNPIQVIGHGSLSDEQFADLSRQAHLSEAEQRAARQ